MSKQSECAKALEQFLAQSKHMCKCSYYFNAWRSCQFCPSPLPTYTHAHLCMYINMNKHTHIRFSWSWYQDVYKLLRVLYIIEKALNLMSFQMLQLLRAIDKGKNFFFFFWPRHAACRILVPQAGIKPAPPVLEARRLNHWTAREVPRKNALISTASF